MELGVHDMETVQERVGMPLDEFIREFTRQPFELINGEKKFLMPNVAGPNYVMHLIYLALITYFAQNPFGEPMIQATFIRPDTYDSNWVKGSRLPDVLVYKITELAEYRAQTPDWKVRPYPLIPLFVVEVVSPTDDYRDVDEKIDLYLADGVAMIWVIDPQRSKARVYTAAGEKRLSGDTVLDGGDVLPGFQMSLSKLLE